jgi:hypothetical protein
VEKLGWMIEDDRIINLSDSVNPQPSIRTVTCIAKLIEAFAEGVSSTPNV